jgi:hypothetical protein
VPLKALVLVVLLNGLSLLNGLKLQEGQHHLGPAMVALQAV